jgi:hypothetical protein
MLLLTVVSPWLLADHPTMKATQHHLPPTRSKWTRSKWTRSPSPNNLEATHRVRREKIAWMSSDGSPVDHVAPVPSTLAIAVMVFQLRVVTGTPKSRSNLPR